MGVESHLNSTFVATAGLRVYHYGNVSLFPELLYTRSAANNVVNAGMVTRYDLNPSVYINIITKYVFGRSGIVGMQLYKENFAVGVSYDFPVVVTNVANTGAVEVGVELRKLVIPRKKIKKPPQRKPSQTQKKAVQKTPVVKPSIAKKPLSPDSIITTKAVEKTDMSSRLKQKQDSVRASAEAGKFQHEPLVLEKATLDFNFDFGSSEVNEKNCIVPE